ncbi:hypothetical protein RJT34_04188 [Clitoria ternatea]|uniref:Uncharacterized protein n=1 Tax=Clitoria ternatea TaxID=43366 RepID=A0AAN9KL50_CLITE
MVQLIKKLLAKSIKFGDLYNRSRSSEEGNSVSGATGTRRFLILPSFVSRSFPFSLFQSFRLTLVSYPSVPPVFSPSAWYELALFIL